MSKKTDVKTGIAYSTEHGRMCPACGQPQGQCACGQKQTASRGGGPGRVALETKGRQGKGVTLISGLAVSPDELKLLAKTLKQKCGSGGTVKNGVIEIQGDHRDLMVEALAGQGYTVKRAGG